MKALVIKSDGTTSSLTPANGTNVSLEEARAVVGGYVELVGLPAG